jgi:hypothetical protein
MDANSNGQAFSPNQFLSRHFEPGFPESGSAGLMRRIVICDMLGAQ